MPSKKPSAITVAVVTRRILRQADMAAQSALTTQERGAIVAPPGHSASRLPGGALMKHGFKVMDSDLHTMEPDDLWVRYLDAPFRKFAPRFARKAQNAPNQPIIEVG